MKKGTKVYIKELKQVGTVEDVAPNGAVQTVKVETPEGPKVVEVLEKGFQILTLLRAIFELFLNFFKK